MKLYTYRGAEPNFGDDLNDWMWPRLLPDFFDEDDADRFLGIGSVLFDDHPATARKIVFGSGYGGYTPLPRIDERWCFYFVRGPRTAAKLGLPPHLSLGDAAILIRALPLARPPKRHAVSFMPHWQSAQYGAWDAAAAGAGMHLIDPRGETMEILDQLLASDLVVTEAMHGAIVADALRIPWVAVEPLFPAHHFKWRDWAEALAIDLRFEPFAPSTWLEAATRRVAGNPVLLRRLRHYGKPYRHVAGGMFVDRAARSLAAAARAAPSLSLDRTIAEITERMVGQLERLVSDHAPHVTKRVGSR